MVEKEIFDFSVKVLNDILNSVEKCNNKLSNNTKDKNSKIIDDIRLKISELNSDEVLVKKDKSGAIELATKELRSILEIECNNIYNLANTLKNEESNNDLDFIKRECNVVFEMVNSIRSMIKGIVFDSDNNLDTIVKTIIKDKINEEEQQIMLIEDETKQLLNNNINDLLNNNELSNYCHFLNLKISKSKSMIYELRVIRQNNKDVFVKSEDITLDLLQDIIEQQYEKLTDVYNNISEFANLDKESIDELNNDMKKNMEYVQNIMDTLNFLNEKKSSDEEIIQTILELKNKKLDENVEINLEERYKFDEVDEEQKKIDTEEYKKNFTIYNKSFWEARSLVSEEGIKYPSALFEKKVKEYQNNYLIDNYNISLESIEIELEEYKEKYAEDTYMDKIYDTAIYELKEETLATLDEMCDDSNGLSMLDLRTLKLLNDDLLGVIRNLAIVKEEENLNGFIDLEEYKKSIKLKNLIDKKEMIEKQIYLINKKRKELEG